jgi:hypothetical protein
LQWCCNWLPTVFTNRELFLGRFRTALICCRPASEGVLCGNVRSGEGWSIADSLIYRKQAGGNVGAVERLKECEGDEDEFPIGMM